MKKAKEIIKLMPVTDKIVVVVGSAFILFSIGFFINRFFIQLDKIGYTPLKIMGATSENIYDPSVEYTPTGDLGYMAYVVVKNEKDLKDPLIHVEIAKSINKGQKWSRVSQPFESKKSELISSASMEPLATGVWRYEMPSLVYDPKDTGKEWKLYASRYFWNGDIKLARLYSMISYRYASSPEGVWSEEKWILSGHELLPPPPYNHLVKSSLNKLHPSLEDLAFYTDPSVLAKKGALFMVLSGFTDKDLERVNRLVLLASLDHGKNWIFVKSLITKEQLAQLGDYTRMSGASLIEYKEKVYLMLSLGDEKVFGQGTFIFEFSDLLNGKLKQTPEGLLKIVNKIPLKGNVFSKLGGGSGDFDEQDEYSGLLVSEALPGTHEFIIHKTELMPVNAEKIN